MTLWTALHLSLLLASAVFLLDDVAMAMEPYQSGSPPVPGQDEHGGVPMGVSDAQCDDGRTNLTIDWDGSIDDFQCTTRRWPSKKKVRHIAPIKPDCTDKFDQPIHVCMNRAIVYHDVIPTTGAHRPLWPRYGEYRFLPKQRWLHSAEHGAAVLLYHPCADPGQVTRLKRIVRGCMRKHIITPFKELTQEKPFALVTYGCKLELPYVDGAKIRAFLREHANTAPEHHVAGDGQFDVQLLKGTKVVSNDNDCEICPQDAFDKCPRAHSKARGVQKAVSKAHHSKAGKQRRKHRGKSHN